MIAETDIAYIAGLFDGEGSIHFKRAPEKKKKHKGDGYRISNSMRISMEITMTDYSVLVWVHETLGVGTLRPKTVRGKKKDGTKYLPQWRWRCTFRDAYHVCLLIWPWSHVKLEKISDIIHYYSDKKLNGENVIHLKDWKNRGVKNV